MALLDGLPRTATVTAASDVLAEVIGHREFSTMLITAPEVAPAILVAVTRRLREADRRLAEAGHAATQH